MSYFRLSVLTCGVAIVVLHSRYPAQAPKAAPSYAKDVRPFLVKYCLECHNAKAFKAGLDLESYKSLREGSDRGPVMEAGKPEQSPLVLLAEGKKEPRMPPKKASRHPKSAEVAVLRAWVAAGAKDDTGTLKVSIPDIKPRRDAAAPVRALAYKPDGQHLAAGYRNHVLLVNPQTGKKLSELKLPIAGEVTALAFSPDGKGKGASLAVACGKPGMAGDIALFSVAPAASSWPEPTIVRNAHQDMILDLAFSPDSKLFATCGYDTRIKLWDASTGRELHMLKDHSDSVYGVSFSPDGKLLASAAADRAVKVWDVAAAKLLYTLGESTDWVYAVAWSPCGDYLAAGGVDRSIRVWKTGVGKGRIAQSVFAHEGPITRLVYAPDGKTLYSVGEDRRVKAWDTARMVERKVYDPQPETPLALALRPDARQLALGRYDGVVVLIDEASGKVDAESGLKEKKVAVPKTQAQPAGQGKMPAPQATKIRPDWGQRGRPIRVTIEGKNLEKAATLAANAPGFTAAILSDGQSPTSLKAQITFPPLTPAGVYQLTLHGPAGTAAPIPFKVDLFSAQAEQEPNDSPGRGQRVSLPVTIAGAIDKAGDVDYFQFEAKKNQQLGVQIVTAVLGSKLEPFLQLIDATGQLLVQSNNGLLGYTFSRPGMYTIGVRDRQLRGGADFAYRLHLGEIPIVTAIFPLGLQRGSEAELVIEGVHLGDISKRRLKAPADAPIGGKLPVNLATPLGTPLGNTQVIVGEFPEMSRLRFAFAPSSPDDSPLGKVPVPGTANGILRKPGQTDLWSFQARKRQRLILEVEARRLGSSLDSFIEVLDARNQPIARATLRSLAKTFVTFRDQDSQTAGMRIDAWDELAVNDYIFVGSELLKIKELPPNPDADCVFVSDRGQRVGFLDTTPTHHSMGTPMYKVEVHPPGTTFPANGFPVVTLSYRNDDGGPGFGRDSRLIFDPPSDGDYRVRLGDSRGQGGSDHAYRLTVRTPRPSFNVTFNPTSPAVFKGGAVPIAVTAERLDGYDGEIALTLENLPPGFSAPATSIPAGENSTVFALFAEPGAVKPAKADPLRLLARARISGQGIVRTVMGGVPAPLEPGDIVTLTEESEVSIKPGQQTRVHVRIERRNNFTGRVPVEVRGLPHGVRVLDIGLNGILITENETRRTMVLYAEPWVQPTNHPFVVLARREGTNAEHAAKSVLLKVK